MASMEQPWADERLLDDILAALPHSREELLFKGAATAIAERMLDLKRAEARLVKQYGCQEALADRLRTDGVSPDDHTPYCDLLEWRAIGHELSALLRLLGALG